MISISTSTTAPFTPAWHCLADKTTAKPGAPTFHLRAGLVIERSQFEAELAGPNQARRVYGLELARAVRNGVDALPAGDPEFDRVVAALADEEEKLAAGEEPAPDDLQLLEEIRKILATSWPEYRDLKAVMARRAEIMPILAVQRFCVRWDGVGVDLTQGWDGSIPDEVLRTADPWDLLAAGNRAYEMLYAGPSRGKLLAGRCVRQRPDDFAFGRYVDGGWLIGDQRWTENPRIALPAWVWPVIDLWLVTRRYASPFGGSVLACSGSSGEQPAALLDALAILDEPGKDGG